MRSGSQSKIIITVRIMFHFNRCITEWDCQVPLGPLIFHGGKLQLQKTENNHKETKKKPKISKVVTKNLSTSTFDTLHHTASAPHVGGGCRTNQSQAGPCGLGPSHQHSPPGLTPGDSQ